MKIECTPRELTELLDKRKLDVSDIVYCLNTKDELPEELLKTTKKGTNLTDQSKVSSQNQSI